MTDDAKHENEACEAVVREFEAFLRQHDAPDAVLRLCDELANRILLRRLFKSDDESDLKWKWQCPLRNT